MRVLGCSTAHFNRVGTCAASEKLEHALALNKAYGKAMIVLAKVMVEQVRCVGRASTR